MTKGSLLKFQYDFLFFAMFVRVVVIFSSNEEGYEGQAIQSRQTSVLRKTNCNRNYFTTIHSHKVPRATN